MAGCYFLMTLYVVFTNLPQLPGVLARIFSEAFGLRQAAAGGFGAVVMNGVKRGLFPMKQAPVLLPARRRLPSVTTRSRWDWCRRWAF